MGTSLQGVATFIREDSFHSVSEKFRARRKVKKSTDLTFVACSEGITGVALNVNRQILFALKARTFRHARPFSASKRADHHFPGTRHDSTPFAIPRVKTHGSREIPLFGGIIIDSSRFAFKIFRKRNTVCENGR